MNNKVVWWTTGICAVIGIFGGFISLLVLGLLGFFISFTIVKLHEANQSSKKKDGKSLLTKMVEAQEAANNRHESIKRDRLKAKMKCPRCNSTNIQPVGKHKRGFSVGKAVGGAVLTGGVGTLAGFAGKQTGKSDWVCLDCGKSFTIK